MRLSRQINSEIRAFLISNVEDHPSDLVRLASNHFGLTRQAIHNHIRRLINEGLILTDGKGKGTRYRLAVTKGTFTFELTPSLDEDRIWSEYIVADLPVLSDNVRSICSYGFTEMLNNAKDHSAATSVLVGYQYTAASVSFHIVDRGIGIFRKIQEAFQLSSRKDAILELAKGKLTTDPDNHSGEGIFFTSRMFDSFQILSEDLFFSAHEDDDWLLEVERPEDHKGTFVLMRTSRFSTLEPADVFNKYAPLDGDESGFSRTHVPVRLVQHEGEALVSRSQAKRLVARFGSFREIVLDFKGITSIGQGFADQIFRVFKRKHPEVNILTVNVSENVERMIKHVLAANQSSLF